MAKVKANWDGANLIPEFDFLSDNSSVIYSGTSFATFCLGSLIHGYYTGNSVVIDGASSNILKSTIKSRFEELEFPSNNNNELIIEFVDDITDRIVIRTYWLV